MRARSASIRSGYRAGGSSGRTADSSKSGRRTSASRGWVALINVRPPSRGGWGPWSGRAARAVEIEELVRLNAHPWAPRPVGPEHADVGHGGGTEPDVGPAELPPGLPPTDRELAPGRRIPDLHLEPGADRVDVRTRLMGPDLEP